MRLAKLSRGERIATVSAILLFVLMFFHWFGSKDSGELHLLSVDRSAWEALDYIPVILVLTIVAPLTLAMLRFANAIARPVVAANAVVGGLGVVSVLLIVFRITNPPNFGSFREVWGNVTIEGTIQFPIFLALVAAAGIAIGGCLAFREEATFLSSSHASRDRRPET